MNIPPIDKVLDLARWAPSGDNMQTWGFEVVSDSHAIIHAYDTRDFCVYDLEGKASQIAFGALIENIILAASGFGLSVRYELKKGSQETRPIFDLFFTPDPNITASPLLSYLKTRKTQRRPLKTTPLNPDVKKALEKSLGEHHQVKWIEGFRQRLAFARILFLTGKIRLTMPEAYPTHKSVIEKGARYSKDRIPDQAVGLDPLAVKVMHWAMESWERVSFFNRYLAGTIAPRLQLDFLPGIFCGAHFILYPKTSNKGVLDQIESGRAVQRFWLTAESLGLKFQPEMSPLIFTQYILDKVHFTEDKKVKKLTQKMATKFQEIVGEEIAASAIFCGRLGYGKDPVSRSLRFSLDELKERRPE